MAVTLESSSARSQCALACAQVLLPLLREAHRRGRCRSWQAARGRRQRRQRGFYKPRLPRACVACLRGLRAEKRKLQRSFRPPETRSSACDAKGEVGGQVNRTPSNLKVAKA